MTYKYARVKNNLKEIGEVNWYSVEEYEGEVGKLVYESPTSTCKLKFSNGDNKAFYKTEIVLISKLEAKVIEVLNE